MADINRKQLFIGQEVIINFGPNDISISEEMRKFNGKTAKISRVGVVRKSTKTDTSPGYYYYYELKGIQSKAGKPFAFTRDSLKLF